MLGGYFDYIAAAATGVDIYSVRRPKIPFRKLHSSRIYGMNAIVNCETIWTLAKKSLFSGQESKEAQSVMPAFISEVLLWRLLKAAKVYK